MKKIEKRPQWYEIHVTTCPPCGAEAVERIRRYGKKPENPYVHEELYNYCVERGLI